MEGKISDATKSTKALAHQRPLAVLEGFFTPKKLFANDLAVLHCTAICYVLTPRNGIERTYQCYLPGNASSIEQFLHPFSRFLGECLGREEHSNRFLFDLTIRSAITALN